MQKQTAGGQESPLASRSVPSTKQFAAVINGVHTEFILTPFADRIFIVITQLGKLGTLITASKETNDVMSGEPQEANYAIDVLLGKRDEPLLALYARRIVELICAKHARRSLLLSLCLKDHSLASLPIILDLLEANKVW
ncbi:Proteasome assembly chaperone 3 [Balamuthia mandrillaris]